MALADLPTTDVYNKLAITTDQQRENILGFTGVDIDADATGNIAFDTTTGFIGVKNTLSGGGGNPFSSLTLDIPAPGLPTGFAFQTEVLLPDIPADFSSLATDRIFIGVENDGTSFDEIGGFLISAAGIALAKSNLEVLELIPDTAALVASFNKSQGAPLTLRVAVREDTALSLIQISVSIGQTKRASFSFPTGSPPFSYVGPDRLNIEVLSPSTLDTREILVGFMGVTTNFDTYEFPIQPNPGADQVVELGSVVRLDGAKSLPDESVIESGKTLRSVRVENLKDPVTDAIISRTGHTAPDGSGFTDTFILDTPDATDPTVSIPNTVVNDFIEINGISFIIATITVGATITITVDTTAGQAIAVNTTVGSLSWQIFSRNKVEVPDRELIGITTSDTLRINAGDNIGLFPIQAILTQDFPFQIELGEDLKVADEGMDFSIGAGINFPTIIDWIFESKPADSALVDFTDFRHEGSILRFIPDVEGTYQFLLMLDSFVPTYIAVFVEVVEARVSPGETPDAEFIWRFLSDFWSLLPDRKAVQTHWSASIQIVADELLKLYQKDYNKSVNDIQRKLRRKWSKIDTRLDITDPVLSQETLPFDDPFYATNLAQGLTKVDNEFQHTLSSAVSQFFTDTSLNAGLLVEIGDVLLFDDLAFAVSDVLSSNELRVSGPGFVEDVTVGSWNLKKGLFLEVEEDLEALDIRPGDTVRFVITEGTNVFRVEEDILLVRGRRVYLNPDVPRIAAAIADRVISFSDVVIEIEGLRRQNVFPLEQLVVDVPLLQETIDQPLSVFKHNLNYLVGPKKLTVIPDFEKRVPFSTLKASGSDGEQKVANVFEDVNATFISDGISPDDQLHVGLETFRIFRVDSETTLTVTGTEFEKGIGRTSLSWRIDRIAPDRLWAEFIDLDNSPSIQANFGHLVNLLKAASDELKFDYLSAVKGLFRSFFKGKTIENIQTGMELLNGLPVAEESGVILSITNLATARVGRMRIQDIEKPEIIRIYFFPQVLGLANTVDPVTGEFRPLQVGDRVDKFQGLAKGVEVTDYLKSPLWWKTFTGAGLLTEIEKFATFQVVINVEIFDISNLDEILGFLNEIKPTYVKIAFLVLATKIVDNIEVAALITDIPVTKKIIDGVFVPPFVFNTLKDGAGAPLFRLDHDTNWPISTSPHVRLAEVSRFDDKALAREAMVSVDTHSEVSSNSDRHGTGFFAVDQLTFSIEKLQFQDPSVTPPGDVGRTIIINNEANIVDTVVSADQIRVKSRRSDQGNVRWAIFEDTGSISFKDRPAALGGPTPEFGILTDLSVNFLPGGVERVWPGDILEIFHPTFNGGTPFRFSVSQVIDATSILFDNFSTLFDDTSSNFSLTLANVGWRVLRGTQYMPKPALGDPDLGTNNVLNESLVPFERIDTTFIAVDSDPTDDSGDTIISVPALANGAKLFESIFSTVGTGAGVSLIAAFNDTSLITASAPQPIDGSAATPLGRPEIKKIVLFDVLDTFSDPTENEDGLLDGFKEIQIYRPTDETLDTWVLHETFNTPGNRQVSRFFHSSAPNFSMSSTTIILTNPLPGDIKAVKIHFPTGLQVIKGLDILNIAEIDIHLSEEFEHLKKNNHLDLPLDSRVEDVVAFERNLADGNSLAGTGDIAGDGITFTDTSFATGVVFCSYDLGKSITIGSDTRVIVDVLPSGSTLNTIKLNSALTTFPATGLAWSISKTGGISDGDTL